MSGHRSLFQNHTNGLRSEARSLYEIDRCRAEAERCADVLAVGITHEGSKVVPRCNGSCE